MANSNKTSPIPPGWEQITNPFNVRGISKYQNEAKLALKGDYMQRPISAVYEPDNKFDKNAIAIFVKTRMFKFFNTNMKLGYLPADLAEVLCYHNLNNKVQPRMISTYVTNKDILLLKIDLVCCKEDMDDTIRDHINQCEI